MPDVTLPDPGELAAAPPVLGEPPPAIGMLKLPDGAMIRHACWEPPQPPRATLLMLNGRSEFIEKYDELARGWTARGYRVFSLDWRGQGRSTRPLPPPRQQRHYLPDFEVLEEDLQFFLERVVLPRRDRTAGDLRPLHGRPYRGALSGDRQKALRRRRAVGAHDRYQHQRRAASHRPGAVLHHDQDRVRHRLCAGTGRLRPARAQLRKQSRDPRPEALGRPSPVVQDPSGTTGRRRHLGMAERHLPLGRSAGPDRDGCRRRSADPAAQPATGPADPSRFPPEVLPALSQLHRDPLPGGPARSPDGNRRPARPGLGRHRPLPRADRRFLRREARTASEAS